MRGDRRKEGGENGTGSSKEEERQWSELHRDGENERKSYFVTTTCGDGLDPSCEEL